MLPSVSESPRLAATGDRPLDGCDAIGFPDATIPPGSARETEQTVGVLHPAGGGRSTTAPFDLTSAPPTTERLWQGFSGAAVRDEHRRFVGVVVAARELRERRRLLVCLAADFAQVEGFAAAAEALCVPHYPATRPTHPPQTGHTVKRPRVRALRAAILSCRSKSHGLFSWITRLARAWRGKHGLICESCGLALDPRVYVALFPS